MSSRPENTRPYPGLMSHTIRPSAVPCRPGADLTRPVLSAANLAGAGRPGYPLLSRLVAPAHRGAVWPSSCVIASASSDGAAGAAASIPGAADRERPLTCLATGRVPSWSSERRRPVKQGQRARLPAVTAAPVVPRTRSRHMPNKRYACWC